MMGVGLVMSYSRGAWVGTAIGLLYLAKHAKAESGTHLRAASARQERKAEIVWYVAPIIIIATAVIVAFWNTPDSSPWFIKRLDFSRGSVQHRVAAWKAGFEIIRDHPFGVGWNKAVSVYDKNYSPLENSAGALTMNSYLMLGTELGLPGLACFIAYAALCLRSPKSKVQGPKSAAETEVLSKSEIGNRKSEIANRQDACATLDIGRWTLDARLRIACRSAAIAMLVAFWFDGGLFKLATASVFWILLELGTERQTLKTETLKTVQKAEGGNRKSAMDRSLVTSAATK
jgi:O-antigen ligase